MTLEALKALDWDQLAAIDVANLNRKTIHQEIAKRNEVPTEEPKVEEIK